MRIRTKIAPTSEVFTRMTPVIAITQAAGLLFCLSSAIAYASETAADTATENVRYVDVDGLGGAPSDSNPGTISRPWKTVLKAFQSAKSGQTIVFRGGAYRLERTLHTSDLSLAGGLKATFRGHPGEQAVISTLRPVPADRWKRQTAGDGRVFYSAPAGRRYRVTNVVQDGVPLKRAHSHDRNVYEDTPPESISGPGEWASSIREGRVYLRTVENREPGDSVELCDIGGPGASGTLLFIEATEEVKNVSLELTFDRLTFETGFHGVLIRAGLVEFCDCTFRKSFGDLVNTNSGRFIIDGCDFSAFGESAIDVTGPGDGIDPPGMRKASVIRKCRFHHNAPVRWPGQKGYNGVMLKGGCKDVLVEANLFHDLLVTYGAITLGGASGGGHSGEGINLVARNNLIRNTSGPYAILFAGSHDSSFVNNAIHDSSVDNLIRIILARGSDPDTGNLRPRVANNLFFQNQVRKAAIDVGATAASGLQVDHNLLYASGRQAIVGETEVALGDDGHAGFNANLIDERPLFRGLADNNLQPLDGSPVIDRGTELPSLVPVDFEGTPRPAGPRTDIGPFEFR